MQTCSEVRAPSWARCYPRRRAVVRPLSWAAGIAVATMVLAPPPAQAGTFPYSSIFVNPDEIPHVEEVADPEMAELRGRFVGPFGVMFFGLQLFTVWQTADGVIMTVGLNLEVDFPANVTAATGPELRAVASFFHGSMSTAPSLDLIAPETIGDPDSVQDANLLDGLVVLPVGEPLMQGVVPATVGVGGLERVRGVVQGIHLAGDDNGVRNDLQINIANQEAAGSVLAQAGPVGLPLEVTETVTRTFESGAAASAIIEQNKVGILIDVPGLGIVSQEIRGAGFNHIAQFASLTSSFNVIDNLMNITFQLQPLGNAAPANVGAILQTLRGL